MDRVIARLTQGRAAILVILAVAAATIGTALFSQHVLGYIPCRLCYWQRQPYYVAMPVALALIVMPLSDRARRGGLLVLALIFLVGAALGAYHAGVEWGFWPGPADCGGAAAAGGRRHGRFPEAARDDARRELHRGGVPLPRPFDGGLERGGVARARGFRGSGDGPFTLSASFRYPPLEKRMGRSMTSLPSCCRAAAACEW